MQVYDLGLRVQGSELLKTTRVEGGSSSAWHRGVQRRGDPKP